MSDSSSASTPGTRIAGKVKGTLLLARLKYLEAQGPEKSGRVVRHLSKADQESLRGIVLQSGWYPADLLLRLEMTAAAILASGDRTRLFLDMGRFSAATNLGPTGVQRAFVREGDPQRFLADVPRMYASQHSSGHRAHEPKGERAALVRTLGDEELAAEDCLTTIGWLQHAIEICGGKSVSVVETRCRARKADCCEFRCEWL
ncbi:DUF2378 family protein [Anaeromyxobacter terrae]|uniref:DUF2378 family protein n=1 Tax=Anaeromyxobacter terrae TaxID=2925406 RepID=UPI001F58254B|nr:TIGR02265 family protein [Anaeromyxobacter sp. SG22]